MSIDDVPTVGDALESAVSRRDYLGAVRILRGAGVALPAEKAALFFFPEFGPGAIEAIRGEAAEAEAVYVLATEYWSVSEHKLEAVDILRVAIDAGSAPALEVIGDALDWLGAYEQAIPYLQRARAEGIGYQAWIAGLLGHARRELRDRGDDVHELLREGASEHVEFGVDFAHSLLERDALEEARTLLRRLVEQNVPGSHIMLGNLLDDEFDDPEGAAVAYLGGIAEGDSHSAYNLAILHHHQGNVDESDHFRRIAREMGDLSAWPYPDGGGRRAETS
ncbi:hypothetical protein ACYX8G_16090 [Microbacterium saperdae]